MRFLAVLSLVATPVFTWEASVEGPVCVLSHEFEGGQVKVTHDPHAQLPYAIAVSRAESSWTPSPVFSMRFEGAASLTISTDRQRLSDEGRTLTVADVGFGNVLRGLADNQTAHAILGAQNVSFPLAGAAQEVERFRDCSRFLGA